MQPSTAKRNIAIATPCTGEDEWHAVREPIVSGWLTQGPKVRRFEEAFAELHQVKRAIATTSCTTALHLALASLEIRPGDEVIVPAFTWIATANVVRYCQATPVFVDVDRTTFNIDSAKVAAAVTPKTKAIIAVHLFGKCAEMDELHNAVGDIPIIEDAACAAGATYRGRPAGSLGRVGCFSFHPRKSITTGEGGMLTTNDEELGSRIDVLRNHGASISEEQRHHGPRPYLLPEFNLLGFNYRMTDLQGAIGLVQLGKLEAMIEERSKWANFYRQELDGIPWLRLPKDSSDSRHGWQAYVCYVDPKTAPLPRNQIMQLMQDRGVSTRPGTHAVHMLGYYRETMGIEPDDFPAARDCDQHSMAIPLHNAMTAEDYHYVVEVIRSIESQASGGGRRLAG